MQEASGWGSALERGLPRRKGVRIHGRVGVEGKIRKEGITQGSLGRYC